jgi:hypothetical protein
LIKKISINSMYSGQAKKNAKEQKKFAIFFIIVNMNKINKCKAHTKMEKVSKHSKNVLKKLIEKT